MADLKEQCFRLVKMSWEVCEMFKTAFSGNAFGRTRLWIGLLAQMWENMIEDCEGSGHPCTDCAGENMEEVCRVIRED